MADFCNTCLVSLFFLDDPSDTRTIDQVYADLCPDIDVFKIFEGLQPNYMSSGHLCEGCGLVAIMKTENEQLKFATMFQKDKTGPIEWRTYPDLRIPAHLEAFRLIHKHNIPEVSDRPEEPPIKY